MGNAEIYNTVEGFGEQLQIPLDCNKEILLHVTT
jgi:hypothetical protein